MKERPILFSAPMVRAILSGQKTQTRRVVKPYGAHHLFAFLDLPGNPTGEWAWCSSSHVVSKHIRCPYGQPGDQLWVREAWGKRVVRDACGGTGEFVVYRASNPDAVYCTSASGNSIPVKWKPSIHMPRWASRIQLEIIAVRVERLQEISFSDAYAEGVTEVKPHLKDIPACSEHRHAYEDLWVEINGTGSWNTNPWVWVIEFKVIKGGAA